MKIISSALCAALLSITALQAQSLVNIETVFVGDAGNAPDTTEFGSVAYDYRIGRHEVTIGQYADFLNVVSTTNANSYIVDLWSPAMAGLSGVVGINREGSGTIADPFVYSPIGSSSRPIAFVSWFDAARFANWLNNGATSGASTETGAYTLNGATNGVILKNPEAVWWIPSEDEWYKAAYYKGGSTNAGYWRFPTQSDSDPTAEASPPGTTNSANFNNVRPVEDKLTEVGAYTTSGSAYGTFDQGGNLSEWNDLVAGSGRGIRGGYWGSDAASMLYEVRSGLLPNLEGNDIGFRVATVPEPSTYALLLMTGVGALWLAKRKK